MTIVDNRLVKNLPDANVFVSANSINKTLRQAIIDGDIGGGGGGGGTRTEIFNHTVSIGAPVSTLTGLSYFMAPAAMTISFVRLMVFEKGAVSSGFLEVDIKKNTTANNVGMTSILTTRPIINFATDPNYTLSSGVLATSTIGNNEFLRLDVTSIPSGWAGGFQVIVYGV